MLGPPAQVGNGQNGAAEWYGRRINFHPCRGRGLLLERGDSGHVGAGEPEYSPFSENANLVLELSPRDPGPEIPAEDVEMINTIRGSVYSQRLNLALRKAQMGLASYLAEMVLDSEPASVDTYELTEVDPALPRVAYACQVMGETLYGISIGWQPTLLHPNELMDGAIYRPFNTPGAVRTTIYHHQNNSLMKDLYQRHGKDLNFFGVLLVPAGPENAERKGAGHGLRHQAPQNVGRGRCRHLLDGWGAPGSRPHAPHKKLRTGRDQCISPEPRDGPHPRRLRLRLLRTRSPEPSSAPATMKNR